MKKLFSIPLMLLAILMVETACSGSSGIGASERDAATLVPVAASLNINIIVGNQTITATMEDNGAARDLRSPRLPFPPAVGSHIGGLQQRYGKGILSRPGTQP